jgi:hypothetical protein
MKTDIVANLVPGMPRDQVHLMSCPGQAPAFFGKYTGIKRDMDRREMANSHE